MTLNHGKDVLLGQLWLELLRFYTLEFALEESIISIRLKELLSREMKNWPRRRLAIEGQRLPSVSLQSRAAAISVGVIDYVRRSRRRFKRRCDTLTALFRAD